jgi:hypothetical protein
MPKKGSYIGGSTIINTGRPRAAYVKSVKSRQLQNRSVESRRLREFEFYLKNKDKITTVSVEEGKKWSGGKKINGEKKERASHTPGTRFYKNTLKKRKKSYKKNAKRAAEYRNKQEQKMAKIIVEIKK